ncbi:MAG TPA: polymer-forming cytoskeletal protein [Candidatus Marinimicrobia bacterium]|nr:polymer-forming cytoskeletal protein [Candidatus Neomarinimicrobiota bacterium]
MMKEKPTYTIIGDDTEIKGDINVRGSLVIAGRIYGNVTADETVSITAGSIVTGTITARNVYINGTVKKGVKASGKVVLSPDSRLEGTLKAAKLIIEEGAFYSGICSMENEEPEPEASMENSSE